MSSTTMTVQHQSHVANVWDAAVPVPPIAVLPQHRSLSPLSDPPSPIAKAPPLARTSDPSSAAPISSSKPRPRPRPVRAITRTDDQGRAATDNMAVDPSHDTTATNDDLFPLSLAERAKLRSRKAKVSASDVPQDQVPPTPNAEITPARSSKRKRGVEKAATLEVIDLSSDDDGDDDDDELGLRPSAKKHRSPTESEPMAVRKSTEPASAFPSSPLPPSDLPAPTSTATTTDVQFQHMPPEPIFVPPPLLSPSAKTSRDAIVAAELDNPLEAGPSRSGRAPGSHTESSVVASSASRSRAQMMVEVVVPDPPYELPGKKGKAGKDKKAKAPPKAKSKKGAKKNSPEDDNNDYSNYDEPAPKSGRAKGKGKKKAAEDEIEFKSNEVIADSDEEDDFLNIRKTTSGTLGDSPEDGSTSSKRKSNKTAKSKGKKAVANPSRHNADDSLSPLSNQHASTNGKSMRNRNVILSDDEDELAAVPPEEPPQESVSRPPSKAKQPKKTKEPRQNAMSPDNNGDDDYAKQSSSNNSNVCATLMGFFAVFLHFFYRGLYHLLLMQGAILRQHQHQPPLQPVG
jgi:hypothetical protein